MSPTIYLNQNKESTRMFQSLNNVMLGIFWWSLTEQNHSFTTNSFLEGYVIWTQSFGVKLGNHLGKDWLYKSQYKFCNRTFKLNRYRIYSGGTNRLLHYNWTDEWNVLAYRTSAKYDSVDFKIFIKKIWKIKWKCLESMVNSIGESAQL